jgi:hypothetical protein
VILLFRSAFVDLPLWVNNFQIRCTKSDNPACSGKPQTVMITDMNYYPVARYHFDLSGTAFGAMAQPGLNDKLRHAGIIDMEFRRSAFPFVSHRLSGGC